MERRGIEMDCGALDAATCHVKAVDKHTPSVTPQTCETSAAAAPRRTTFAFALPNSPHVGKTHAKRLVNMNTDEIRDLIGLSW
jgi:hypothetical protein